MSKDLHFEELIGNSGRNFIGNIKLYFLLGTFLTSVMILCCTSYMIICSDQSAKIIVSLAYGHTLVSDDTREELNILKMLCTSDGGNDTEFRDVNSEGIFTFHNICIESDLNPQSILTSVNKSVSSKRLVVYHSSVRQVRNITLNVSASASAISS